MIAISVVVYVLGVACAARLFRTDGDDWPLAVRSSLLWPVWLAVLLWFLAGEFLAWRCGRRW